ncbi:alpha/beta fold hydrolase [Sutcliffiella halmapala]|uniref:alpha/beta fold hydrolase n=1 Tax=Sutcliffiella halmapala TaxID=79882 RepID=UPI000995B88F|nr:alpha/beta hydrolase [Sutcliffiella halmapala]
MAEYESTIQKDISLYYEDRGVGKPIVLLHGFCGSHAYWKYIIEDLSIHYRVIAIDLRGHGKSAVSEDSFSITDMAQDVQLLLQQLEIEHATVIGHSLGGYVTLELVENYPELINAFGLVHSTGAPDSDEAKLGREKAINRINEEGMNGFIEDLVQKLFAKENLEEMNSEIEFVKKIGFTTSVNGAEGALNAMKERKDLQRVVKESDFPILLLAGKGDQVIPVEKTFIAKGPNIMQVLLEESGHMSMLEEPKALADAISDFLKMVEGNKKKS